MIDLTEHLPMARDVARYHARFARWIADELEGEAALALVRAHDEWHEGMGDFAEFARPRIVRAVGRMIARERRRAAREVPGGDDIVRGSAADAKPVPITPAPGRTPGQRHRARRNVVIAIAHRAGCSQRMLADVFDLPRSRIWEIVAGIGAAAS